ncbi:MAG: hypothetical protein FD138_1225 [Planctomycetota bacterium]|nr:MAG: hypothetical protein FD138_1225 [Planctomycetota bacterium]
MSPRVAFWTSAFEADMEAISSEVALLLRRFPESVRWGLSHRHWALLNRQGFCLHPKLHLLFRAATRLLEPLFEINHVFGSVGDWFYLQGQRRRPTVLTTAAASPPVDRELLDRVDRFVVEHPAGRDDLRALGIGEGRIRLVMPPVDLQRFVPTNKPSDPFTVLFAIPIIVAAVGRQPFIPAKSNRTARIAERRSRRRPSHRHGRRIRSVARHRRAVHRPQPLQADAEFAD